MKKPVYVLILAVLLTLICATVAFAATYSVSFQIINADTFEIIQAGTLIANLGAGTGESAAKDNIRRQLGFQRGSDTRTVGGVTQRIIWVSVTRQ